MEKDTIKGISSPYEALGMCTTLSFGYAKKYADKQPISLVRINDITTQHKKEHWAIYIKEENKVIDLTARQFTTKVKPKFVADLEDWLDEACEWIGDSLVYQIYEWPNVQESVYQDYWLRDEIDPETFEPENAGWKMMLEKKERK